jgi:glycosyltransferase involved in cell wall biosynthesis
VVGSRVLSYWREAGLSVDDAKVVHFYASQAEVKTANLTAAQQFREKYGRRKVILYFGRLIKRKGIDYLIKAFAVVSKEIPEAILVIAGDGPEKHSLQNLCKELGLNDVIFTGYVSEEEKATILLSCDLFVYPTITINVPEEWGLAVNEAMSVGKPAIVTNAVGCAFDLVQPEITGFVVPEKDILNLSYAIRKALTDDAARIRMGKASKELIEREYTYACMDSKMNDIVKKILYR